MKGITFSFATVAVAALLGAACTVHQTEAPDLAGPSETALSVTITASPDSISQDGRSTSTIGVQARDANGKLLSNLPFRLDMLVNGQPADYGTLSNRNLVTGSDGRASAVYTAPPAPPTGSIAGGCTGGSGSVALAGRCVQIVATSVSTDYFTAAARMVEIHLIPVGVIVPASATPVASFVTAPSTPKANDAVQFDASKSCAGATDASGNCPAGSGIITSYAWNFGDGTAGSGRTAGHVYTKAQTYLVTLTVTNDLGLSASSTQSVEIGAGAPPSTPTFVFSPSTPVTGAAIYFDASQSQPATGHSLVRYVWNWGDGTAFTDTNFPATSHTYAAAATYNVVLTVADDTGQTASFSKAVTVAVPAP